MNPLPSRLPGSAPAHFATLGQQAEAATEAKENGAPEVDAVSSDEDNEADNSEDDISVDDADSEDAGRLG